MIKINLLPTKLLKKTEKARVELLSICLLLIFCLSAAFTIHFQRQQNITNLLSRASRYNEEKNNLSKLTKINDKISATIQSLQADSKILVSLQNNQSISLNLLHQITKNVDQQHIRLKSLHRKNNVITITGVATNTKTLRGYLSAINQNQILVNFILTKISRVSFLERDFNEFIITGKIN